MNESIEQSEGASRRPRVSIGLPVYNGERFLPMAVDALLNQTFADFELILCDNASTDSTESLCRSYESRDPRVRYYRNPENIGAGPNFNKTVHLARGEYFKWSSDDDVCSLNFLERCVEILDRDRSVVMAYPKVSLIDETGAVRGPLFRNVSAGLPRPSQRFGEILGKNARGCQGIFGLMRIEALRRTPLLQPWWASDRNILARLALVGRLVEVDSADFYFRTHPGRSTREYPSPQAHSVWFDPKQAGRNLYPRWWLARDYMAAVTAAPISFRQKAACCRHLLLKFRWSTVLKDLLIAASEIGRPKRSQQRVPSVVRGSTA